MKHTAIQGTKSILEACIKHKIKKMIVTSAAFNVSGAWWKHDKGEINYDEKDFAPLEQTVDPYAKSKII